VGEDVVILIPRGHLKTTVLTVGSTLWMIVKNPNMRHFLASDTIDVSERFLFEIKQNIQHNERLKLLFPRLKPLSRESGGKWKKDQILIERQTRVKDPTITAMSAGQAMTGTHYDRGIYDDIMTEKNAATEEKIDFIIRWYHSSQPLLDPGSHKIIVGTRYRDNDIYGHLAEETDLPFYVRKAVEDGEPLWKSQIVVDHVKKMRRELPSSIFSAQYMNDPIDAESQEFLSEWIQRWTIEDVRGWMSAPENAAADELLERWYGTLNIYMGCDPSRTVRKRSDYTAVMIVGVDQQERRFVLDYVRKKIKSPEIIRLFVSTFEKWRPLQARIETVGGDEHLFPLIRNALIEKGLQHHRLRAFSTHHFMMKEDRIRALVPPFEKRMYWIKEDHDDLANELLRFPFGKHDDLIDTLAYMERQCIKPPKANEERPRQDGWKARRKRLTANRGNWLTV